MSDGIKMVSIFIKAGENEAKLPDAKQFEKELLQSGEVEKISCVRHEAYKNHDYKGLNCGVKPKVKTTKTLAQFVEALKMKPKEGKGEASLRTVGASVLHLQTTRVGDLAQVAGLGLGEKMICVGAEKAIKTSAKEGITEAKVECIVVEKK